MGQRVFFLLLALLAVQLTAWLSPALAESVAWRFRMDSPYALHRQAVAPNGTVYVQDVHGFLYALTYDGALRWTYNAGSYPSGGGGEGPVALHPDGTILVVGNPLGPEVKIHAVNPDGRQRWVFTDTGTQGVIAGPAVGPDGNIYFVTDFGGRGLVALSPSGGLLWSNPGSPTLIELGQLGEEIAFGSSEPGGPVNQLYCAFDEYGVGGGDRLFGFSLGGSQRFASATGLQGDPLGQRQGQPAAGHDGTVYVCASAAGLGWRLQAFDPRSGNRLWTHFPIGTNTLTEPDIGPDGTIYVARNGIEVHAIRPDQSERWVHSEPVIFFGPIASPANDVVLAGGRITYGAPGFVKALAADNGGLLWTIDFPSEGGLSMIPFSRPTFSPDGRRAYVSTTLPGQPAGEEYCYLYAIDVRPAEPTSVQEIGLPSAAFSLAAFPNPFAEDTRIAFRAAGSGYARVRVYDVGGRLVRSLHRGTLEAGPHALTWDGRDELGREANGGIFLVRVETAAGSESLKITRGR